MTSLFKNLINLIFPHQCCNCWRLGAPLCEKCYLLLEPSLTTLNLEIRPNKKIILIYSAVLYSRVAKTIVRALKYNSVKNLAKVCAFAICTHCTLPKADLIIPVASHQERIRARGFNQAEEIAKELSFLTHVPLANLLVRNSYSESSAKKQKNERIKEKPSFSLKDSRSLTGKCVLLVDDVITTGSTISAAVTTLLTKNPKEISIVCFAQTI